MKKAAVIGGGAAGMMAAYAAARAGWQVTILDHSEKLGKKIYITGKGRCNLTNACEPEEFFPNVMRNPKFVYSAIYGFDSRAAMDFFESRGLRLKVERGNRVFPVSDHASDVIRTLQRELERAGVEVCLNTHVDEILIRQGRVSGLRCGEEHLCFDAVIAACGGASYPTTGSDGSGWELVRQLGHTVTAIRPALIGLCTAEPELLLLQGLSLKNVTLTLRDQKKVLYQDFGELLFTHQGISGPLVLTAASRIPDRYFLEGAELKKPIPFEIDLKPALTPEQLDRRLLRDFTENQNRQFKNALSRLLPSKLIPVVIERSGIDPERQVNAVTREERQTLARLLKAFPGTVTGLGRLEEAIITRGGVRVREVNPSTMESRLVPGLYLCGEMLDVDALTGGYNLQIAWATGYLAGSSLSDSLSS